MFIQLLDTMSFQGMELFCSLLTICPEKHISKTISKNFYADRPCLTEVYEYPTSPSNISAMKRMISSMLFIFLISYIFHSYDRLNPE